MRAYLVALGLATFFVGLPVLFAGYVGIGCSTTEAGGATTYSNCGGASGLELAGAVLIVLALIFFVAAFVPVGRSGS
jgi:hypothetical protein